MTIPVSHVTVRVPLTIRSRPGRWTMVSSGFGRVRADRHQGLPNAAVGGACRVGTSAGRSFVRCADTTHQTLGPEQGVTSNPIT